MTDARCREWMKNQKVKEDSDVSYYNNWILPLHNLNDMFPRFKGRPIGNSPEMMLLDNCLNKDLHESGSRHVLMSRACNPQKSDHRSFSIATPKEVSRTYLRVWNDSMGGVSPSSKRIVQDIKKSISSMHQILKAKGVFVPGLAQRPGDRHIINKIKSKIWGGKRTVKEMVTMLFAERDDLHSDLKDLLAEADARGEGAWTTKKRDN